MRFLRIPFNPTERPEDFTQLNIPLPSIQKLARLGPDGTPLPLVATTSGTAARALIAVQDLGGFNSGQSFDPERAQYLSTLLCGTMVHGGHHSVLEVGEIHNRLIDCQAIHDLDSRGILSNEKHMKYYRIGDSKSLVPEKIRPSVVAAYNAKNQADIKGELQQQSQSAKLDEEDPDISDDNSRILV